jgi:CHASE3 domain sensor protein
MAMTLRLFWRLILGYAAILLLSIGASIYAIVQLGQLNETARRALETDYRTIAQQENLTDAFLSEVRYGGKFLLAQAPSSYDQFRQFKNDFLRYLNELKSLGITAEHSTQLVRIEHLHQSFHELFEQEAGYVKAGQPYAQSRYQQERTRILDAMLRELARLKDQLENTLHEKLEGLGRTARDARNIAVVTTLMLLVLGTALSIKISTSVTNPLVQLAGKLKTESPIASIPPGFSTIPEIRELGEVLVGQQQRLFQAAERNAGDMGRLAEELAARLADLKRTLNECRAQNSSAQESVDRTPLDRLIEETDHLIQNCAEVSASVTARTQVIRLEPQAAQKANTSASSSRNSARLGQVAGENSNASSLSGVARLFTSLRRQVKRQRSNAA